MSKVYVIDDSLSVLIAIERSLSAHGFDVITEKSGLNAVVNLQQEAPDLVICDAILPDVEGFRICAFVKHHPKLSKTPVVMISGIVDDEVREQALKAGAECILKKPFAANELAETVKQFATAKPDSDTPENNAQDAPSVPANTVPALPKPNLDRLRTLFDQLAGLQLFHFVGIADADGEIVEAASVPEAARKDLGLITRTLIQQAKLLTQRPSHGNLEGVIIEQSRGLLLVRPLTDQYTIILALKESGGLGKARLVLRRLHQGLVDALYNKTVESVTPS